MIRGGKVKEGLRRYNFGMLGWERLA